AGGAGAGRGVHRGGAQRNRARDPQHRAAAGRTAQERPRHRPAPRPAGNAGEGRAADVRACRVGEAWEALRRGARGAPRIGRLLRRVGGGGGGPAQGRSAGREADWRGRWRGGHRAGAQRRACCRNRGANRGFRGKGPGVKATAAAHANIALVKYWGKRDEALLLPETGSLSVALDKLRTTTTVELGDFAADTFTLDSREEDPSRARALLDAAGIRQR